MMQAVGRSIGEWQALVATAFLPLTLQAGARPLELRVQLGQLGTLRLAELRCNAHRAVRGKRELAQSDAPYIKFIWQIAGRCRIEQGRRSATLEPGQWLLYDVAQPYEVECSEAANFVTLLAPANELAGARRFIETSAVMALPTTGPARLVLNTLQQTLQHHAELDAEGLRGAEGAARVLLAAALRQPGCAPAVHGDARRARLLGEAQAYIEQLSAEPDFTPERLARLLHMSRRSLYGLFGQDDSTPHARILEARLLACRAALADPAQAHKKVGQIADENGFSGNAYFSRVFKARFGVCPSAWRN